MALNEFHVKYISWLFVFRVHIKIMFKLLQKIIIGVLKVDGKSRKCFVFETGCESSRGVGSKNVAN